MKKLSPNLFVTSVKESIAFYEKFGFKTEQVVPDAEKPIWASVTSGDVEIMLQDKDSGMQKFAVQDPDGYICVFAEG